MHKKRILRLGAFAVAGGLLACTASLLIPQRYTSTAVMRFTASSATAVPAALDMQESTFTISFTYPDPQKARAGARAVVAAFVEEFVREKRDAISHMSAKAIGIEERKAGENLELLNAATLPERPTGPGRRTIAAAGLGGGLLLGLLAPLLSLIRQTPSPAL